jgi:hypothetical protein
MSFNVFLAFKPHWLLNFVSCKKIHFLYEYITDKITGRIFFCDTRVMNFVFLNAEYPCSESNSFTQKSYED